MNTELFDLLEMDPNDPANREALEDVEAAERILATLVQIRKDQKLTQVEVADRMGTTQSVVSKFEGGTGDPHLSTLQRYARAVCVRLRIMATTPRQSGPWVQVERVAVRGRVVEEHAPTWQTPLARQAVGA